MKISRLILYCEPSLPQINIQGLANFLEEEIGAAVEIRSGFFEYFGRRESVLRDIASCRVFNTFVPFERHLPSLEEIESEKASPIRNIILYDGFEMQNVYRNLLPSSELSQDFFHLVITSRLTCSYDYDDYRYHGRAVICSNPAIISTTGIIEAPAKPRDYYLKMHEKIAQGLNIDLLKKDFIGRFLDYGDPRLEVVIRGYAMQAIFYYLTGNPFCESSQCLLHNAHWQEDLIHSQVEVGKLCDEHQSLLDNYRNHYA